MRGISWCVSVGAWMAVEGAAMAATVAEDTSEFHPPVRLQGDGHDIDTGEAWGHSGPTMADVDGDGRRELVVGDFSGKFRVFPNVGSDVEPKFGPQTYLMAGGEEAQVPIYCCIGSSPSFVDYEGDGTLDMISGSYDPGECYLFRGLSDGRYAARETLVGADGMPVLRVPDQQQNHQSFGSWPAMVDWDSDGDLDLLVGGFDGTMFVRLNEGSREKPVLAATNTPVMIGGEELKVPGGHAAPAIVDWDGDGRWDILTGSDSGAVYWYRNIGAVGAPAFEIERILIPKHDGSGYSELTESGAEPVPGIRTQISTTDYNADGKTDLLVGDFRTTITLRPDLAAVEWEELAQIQRELGALGNESRDAMEAMRKEFFEKYPGDRIYSDEADAEWQKTYMALRESEATKAREAKSEQLRTSLHRFFVKPERPGTFDAYETTHGYVWLYLRK